MNSVLSALRREEKKSLKMMNEAEQQLATVRAAIKLVGGKLGKVVGRTRRKMSAATRRKMKAAAKARWAKVKKAVA